MYSMYFILYTLWLLTYPYVFSICGDSWLLFTYLHHFTIIDCHRLLSDLKNKMLCTRCLVWYTIVLYYHCIKGYLPSSGQVVKQSSNYLMERTEFQRFFLHLDWQQPGSMLASFMLIFLVNSPFSIVISAQFLQ